MRAGTAFACALTDAHRLQSVTAFQWRSDPVFSEEGTLEYRALRYAIGGVETRIVFGSPEMIRPCPICTES